MLKFKKGSVSGGILFFVFFFMMIMVSLGLVGGVYAFFGKGYDFRATESNTLFRDISECLEKNKFFEKSVENKNSLFDRILEDKDLFFKTCGLSKSILEDRKHFVYLKRISGNKEFYVGVYDYKIRCGLNSRFKNTQFPLCKIKTFEDYELIVGSSQNSKRVSI